MAKPEHHVGVKPPANPEKPALLGLLTALVWPPLIYFFGLDALPQLRTTGFDPFGLAQRVALFGGGLALLIAGSLLLAHLARRALATRAPVARALSSGLLAVALLATGLAGATRAVGRGPTSFHAYVAALPTVGELSALRADRAGPGDSELECAPTDHREAPAPGEAPVLDRCCAWTSPENPAEATRAPPPRTCVVHVHTATETRQLREGMEQRGWRVAYDAERATYFVVDRYHGGLAIRADGTTFTPVYRSQFADALSVDGALHLLGLLGLAVAAVMLALRTRDLRAHRALCRGREAIVDASGRLELDGESAGGPWPGVAPGPVIVLDGGLSPGAYRHDAALKGRVVPDRRGALLARADRLAGLAQLVLLATASPMVSRAVMALVAPWLR